MLPLRVDVPEDMSDPLLKRWKKPDTNPFLVQASYGFKVEC
jgi:hypothetical protein